MGMLKERLSTFVTKNMISMTFKLIKFDIYFGFVWGHKRPHKQIFASVMSGLCVFGKKERTNMYKGEMIPYAYLISMVNVVKESFF